MRLKAQGKALFKQEKWEECKRVWQQVLVLQEDAEAYEMLGVIEDMQGNHKRANQFLLKAVELRPNSAASRNNLAVSYLHLKRPKEAAQQLERAIRLDPKNPSLPYNLGGIYFEQGEYSQALTPLERARSLAPSDAALQYKLLLSYLHTRSVSKALQLWESSKSLRATPDTKAHLTVAEAFLRNGQFQAAAEAYGSAARSSAQSPELVYNQARALHLARQPERALAVLESVDARQLKTVHFHRLKADLLSELGHLDQALPEYHAAIQLSPDDAENYLRLAVVLLNGEAAGEALAFLKETRERFRDSPRFLLATGYGYQLKGDTKSAFEYYRTAIAKEPSYSLAYIFMGRSMLELGQSSEGLKALEQAVKAEPGSAFAHYQLAKGILRTNPEDKARSKTHLEEAVRLDRSFEDAHYDLGKLRLQEGKLEEARQLLERAKELNPNLGGVHYLLGQLYQRLGELARATDEFKFHERLNREEQEKSRVVKRLIYAP